MSPISWGTPSLRWPGDKICKRGVTQFLHGQNLVADLKQDHGSHLSQALNFSCLVIVEVELRRVSESNRQRERGKINKPESFLKINTGLRGQPGEVSALSRAAGSRAVPGTLKVFGDCLAVG